MWYYALNDLQHGPATESELKALFEANTITAQTMVFRQGMTEWLPLEQTELAAKFEVPLPEGDAWETCAYSGSRATRSEMTQVKGCWVTKAHKAEAKEFISDGGELPTAKSGLRGSGDISLVHLYARAWGIFKDCAFPAIILYWIINGLVVISSTHAVTVCPEWLVWLSVAALRSLSEGCLVYLCLQQTLGRPTSLVPALGGGFRSWGRIAIVSIIGQGAVWALAAALEKFRVLYHGEAFSFVSIITFPLLVYVILRLFLVNVVTVARGLSPLKAFRESWAVTRGYTLATFGLAIASAFLQMLIGCVLSILLLPFSAIAKIAASAEVGGADGSRFKLFIPAWLKTLHHAPSFDLLGLLAIYGIALCVCYYQELDNLRQFDKELRFFRKKRGQVLPV